MKKNILLVLLASIMISCKNKQERLKEQIKPVITKIVIQDSLVSKIDSIIVFQIDTLTDVKINRRKIDKMSSMIDFYVAMMKSHQNMAESYVGSAKLHAQQASLYSSMFGSTPLTSISKDDVNEDVKKYREESKIVKLYNDSVNLMKSKSISILDNIIAHKIDSTQFRGYVANFKLIGANKKGVQVKLDSMFVFLSESLSIIPVNIN